MSVGKVSISDIPDEVLLQIFEYFVGGHRAAFWRLKVRWALVCRRWWFISFHLHRCPMDFPWWALRPWNAVYGYVHFDLFRTRTVMNLACGKWTKSLIREFHDKSVIEDHDFPLSFLGCTKGCPSKMSHSNQLRMQMEGFKVEDPPSWYLGCYFRLSVAWRSPKVFQEILAEHIHPGEVVPIFQSFWFDSKIEARNEHYERLLGATRAFEKLGTWDLCQLLNHTPDEKRGMRWYALLVERLRGPGPRNEEGPGTE